MTAYTLGPITATGHAVLSDVWKLTVLSGTPVTGHAVVADTAISAGRFVHGTITGHAGLHAVFDIETALATKITAHAALGGSLSLSVNLLGVIRSNAEVIGTLIRESEPAEGAEANYEATGVRTSIPLLAYALNVNIVADTSTVPAGGSFVVSASYIGETGDGMYEAGAAPNSIGTVIQPSVGPTYLVFRPPVDEEVIWYVPDQDLYRYHLVRGNVQPGDTAVPDNYVWQKYLSWPERALAGQYWANIFDPSGIYPYYMRVLGACMSEWNYDTRVLLNFYDPSLVSHFFLSALAANYGLELDSSDPLNVQRSKTKNAVGIFKLKGLDKSVRLRIQALGYTGYANEIWVNPTNPTNYRSAVLNAFGTSSSSNTGANDPATTKEYPHGYRTDDGTIDGFYPSSRLAIHLNDGSGNPLNLTSDIKAAVANDLMADVLPAHVDIRYFVTDFTCAEEGVVVVDTLTITHV